MAESAGHAHSRRSVFRGAAVVTGGVLVGGLAGHAFPVQAATVSMAPEPNVRTRADWGARAPSSPAQVLDRAPANIVVHHTATANQSDTSWAAAAALSRAIQNYHMNTNGWADTGQQLTISRGGHIMEGRNRSLPAIRAGDHVVGAHVANYNSSTIGIENEGLYTSATPPAVMINALVATCAWLCTVYGLAPSRIVGHRDFNATACPGNVLYGMLPTIRQRVADTLAANGVRIPAQAALAPQERPAFPLTPERPETARFDHGPALGAGERG
ncbi:peptidoglycan recognition protein family protein [Allonocardiopsis opalescens]|uniref:N-acetylmuramoyl-L-alanine amidase n=1 Tax=Allonocardiopsis opalescens TaxID=1144618 RepID=A0A2T0Q6T2_9ACTN|nr:peptidoglycan recognition family protein [Allonocardiopsis opalescens]PRX99540.1 N-acetylmuramoyl-L-alanine amidase [Allonocardiopsis opalescens]